MVRVGYVGGCGWVCGWVGLHDLVRIMHAHEWVVGSVGGLVVSGCRRVGQSSEFGAV